MVSSLITVVGHLNASGGEPILPEQLAFALSSGTAPAAALGASEIADSSIVSLFVEIEPALIAACAVEARASLGSVHDLYEMTLARGMPRVTRWEKAVEHLL